MKGKLIILGLILGLVWVVPAAASSVNIMANTSASSEAPNPLATYTGELIYTDLTATTATLEVDLNWQDINPATGGFLTAIALNNPNNDISNVTKNSFPANFQVIPVGGPFNNKGINVQPYGQADFGASVTDQWEGGGSPNGGVPAGTAADFIFNLIGTNLNTLNANSFVDALTTGGGGGQQFFLARFRGFDNGGSDKEPALDSPSIVPISPSVLLMGSGLLGLIGLGWRRGQD